MIEHVVIQNFRCFKDLDVNHLKRINVIVGSNSSGKSSFLEAIFLSSSSSAPHIVFQMRAIRKLGSTIQVPADSVTYKSLWEDVFFDFNTDNKVSIQVKGSSGDQRSLSISFKGGTQQEIPFGKDAVSSFNIGGLPQIVFVWKRGGGREIVVKPQVTPTGIQLGNALIDYFPMIWFSSAVDAAEESAKRFSALSKRSEAEPIVLALKNEFGFIEDIGVEFFSGTPMLFASVKGKTRKMPMGLLSDGVNRLLSMLIGIVYYQNGVVLIDQIEDGFYFGRFPSIWKLLHFFAQKYNVQLFISTHSRECLESMKPTLTSNEGDFRLLRAQREENGNSVEQFGGDDLLAALKEHVEIR